MSTIEHIKELLEESKRNEKIYKQQTNMLRNLLIKLDEVKQRDSDAEQHTTGDKEQHTTSDAE